MFDCQHGTSRSIDPHLFSTIDCYERNTNFIGYDLNAQPDEYNYALGSGNRNSKFECQQLCQSTEGCAFFTYDPIYNIGGCFLKTSDRGRSQLQGTVSGPKFCGQYYDIILDTSTVFIKLF